MDPATISSLTALLVAVGGGVGFFVKRSDTRRLANEALLIAHLTAELAKREAELLKKQETINWLEAVADVRVSDGTSWREQLIEHNIPPVPARWSPLPPKETP